jgi:hypothetical protein
MLSILQKLKAPALTCEKFSRVPYFERLAKTLVDVVKVRIKR